MEMIQPRRLKVEAWGSDGTYNISENTAATQVSGQAPKKPLQNRHINIVCRSFPTATPMLKIENPKDAITRGIRRPFSSDKGAQNIGPVANPYETLASCSSINLITGTYQHV